LHDAIEATRKSLLKRSSISKNNRKFLPRHFRIKSARFPESIVNRDFFENFTVPMNPFQDGAPARFVGLFFIFLFASHAIEEKFS